MLILGVDLSLKRSGLVWYDSARNRVVQHKAVRVHGKTLAEAKAIFADALFPVSDIDLAVVEQAIYRSLNDTNAIFRLVLELYGVEYEVVHPKTVKKFIAGSGSADKDVVAKVLKKRYKIHFDDDPGNDLSDAAALAIYGLEHHDG